MFRKPVLCLIPALALLTAFGARFGGWAVVTVDDLPDYLTAGKPATLGFRVRQHGMTLLRDLQPRIEARSGSATTTAQATPSNFLTEPGHYMATVTVPRAGEWTLTIHTGFMGNKLTLLPLRAIDAGAPALPTAPERDRGRRLFVAKGCVSCHVHEEAKEQQSFAVGPELTGRRFPADYLARFLADPSITVTQRSAQVRMPNLGLKDREIAALVTFLNSDRQVSVRDHPGSPR
jgi:hypothetical protein